MGRILGIGLIWAAMVVAQLEGFRGCVEEERVGLLALSPLKGVNMSSDCCLWVGVNCSATTGRVERLSLSKLTNYECFGYFLNISLFLTFQELLELDLSSCDIRGLLHQADFVNMKSLKYLDISHNRLNINFQDFCKMNNIVELNLGYNRRITGPLPDCVGNMTKLQFLNFGYNMLRGNIPPTIGNLSDLRILSLAGNFFEGSFSLSSLANNSKLQYLDLSDNNLQIETEIPTWFPSFQLHFLRLRNLALNILSNSVFPSFLLHQNDLRLIDLSHNQLEGNFPYWLLQNNSQLGWLSLRSNFLTGNLILPDSIHLLSYLDISNNMLSSRLPSWIKHAPSLNVLKVSNNYLEGDIPVELCNMKLLYLDISYNKFSGFIPYCLSNSSLTSLSLRENNLSGAIPSGFLNNLNLISLDLSYNDFSKSILPNWIYSLKNIHILLMAGMQLEGIISMQLCTLENIKILDLSHNSFTGLIPSCLFERSFWITGSQYDFGLDLGISVASDFEVSPTFYNLNSTYDITEGYEVEFTTKRVLCSYRNNLLNYMTGLDLSNNKLFGPIPTEIEYSQAIISLNLSNNQLWGSIPSNIWKMRLIESLDLSSNNLSGEIPSEIINLKFLAIFNVSNNNLSGLLPNGGQFSTFDERNYGGNEYLCGPLLHRDCMSSVPSMSSVLSDEQDEYETSLEMALFWSTFVASYIFVVVFWATILYINPHWCEGLIHMIDVFCVKLYFMIIK